VRGFNPFKIEISVKDLQNIAIPKLRYERLDDLGSYLNWENMISSDSDIRVE
jgi:hypothetical protein